MGGNAEVAQLISGPLPVMPSLARQAKVGGVVNLRAIVGKEGFLKDIQIVNGSPLLRPAALEAVRKWRYRPAMLNGSPVESLVEIRMAFQDR
jgi:protein TonB